ncbi:MAG: hypothetical protein KF780_02300 [Sphingomonas sp.]|nr:hypothetical protein [Sphingomonas sp.]
MSGPGAYAWIASRGAEVSVPALRFAVADRAQRLVSGAWTVRADRHGVFRIAGAGGFGCIKLVLRRRGLAFAYALDGGDAVIGCRLVGAGPRATRWLPAPEAAPWHAISLSFPTEYLRHGPRPPGDPARRPMILLPDAGRGRMVRVAFLLADAATGRIDYEESSDLYLGRVTDGRRSLLVMRRIVESDLAACSARLARLSPEAPLALHARVGKDAQDELGLLLLDAGKDHLDMVELHNLCRRAPAAQKPGQLGFDFGA